MKLVVPMLSLCMCVYKWCLERGKWFVVNLFSKSYSPDRETWQIVNLLHVFVLVLVAIHMVHVHVFLCVYVCPFMCSYQEAKTFFHRDWFSSLPFTCTSLRGNSCPHTIPQALYCLAQVYTCTCTIVYSSFLFETTSVSIWNQQVYSSTTFLL